MADDIQRISGTTAKVAARLCNFATAKSFLLLSHQEFLDSEVAPVIRGMQGPWVDLFGYASRAGDAGFNMTLSKNRLNSVKWRIDQYANNVNFQIQTWYGETESGSNERSNDGYWRAVEVYVYANKPPSPKPPTPQPTLRRITSRSFSKVDAKQDLGGSSDPQKDAINDLLKLGLAAAQGKLTAEGLLGKEDSRDVAAVASNHRVNKVVIDQKRSLDTFVGGSVVTENTVITYEWGPPAKSVTVETRFQFTWDKRPNPPINETRVMPRREAESTPLIVPPDP